MSLVLRAAALGLSLALLPSLAATFARAQDTADDPVVATVDGAEIRLSDVARDQATLPDQYRQMPLALLFDVLRSRAVETELLSAEADRLALDDDPDVQRTLAEMRKIVLRNRMVETAIDEAVTDEALQAAYEARAAEPDFTFDEVRASHILVATEEEAKALIEQIEGGADFAELAAEHSIDPAGAGGGDLGYFAREQMVEPFADAAFSMEVGAASAEPVQSQFGWHVIEVVDRRTVTPSFEDVEPELRAQVGTDAVADLVESLRADAAIEEFDMEGAPAPAAQ